MAQVIIAGESYTEGTPFRIEATAPDGTRYAINYTGTNGKVSLEQHDGFRWNTVSGMVGTHGLRYSDKAARIISEFERLTAPAPVVVEEAIAARAATYTFTRQEIAEVARIALVWATFGKSELEQQADLLMINRLHYIIDGFELGGETVTVESHGERLPTLVALVRTTAEAPLEPYDDSAVEYADTFELEDGEVMLPPLVAPAGLVEGLNISYAAYLCSVNLIDPMQDALDLLYHVYAPAEHEAAGLLTIAIILGKARRNGEQVPGFEAVEVESLARQAWTMLEGTPGAVGQEARAILGKVLEPVNQ